MKKPIFNPTGLLSREQMKDISGGQASNQCMLALCSGTDPWGNWADGLCQPDCSCVDSNWNVLSNPVGCG